MQSSTTFSKTDLKEVYERYFDQLRGFLYYKTGDVSLAEDLVQEVFVKLWEKRETIKKETVKSLLFTMSSHLMINHYNHLKVVAKHQNETSKVNDAAPSPQFTLEEKEFAEKFNNVVSALPDGCKEVFLMNRIDKLKYHEIADRLNLSVKAIEKRMSKALGIIKKQLGVKI